jgi:Na+-transporting NADH:ubiquinone oxidoreductase subunit C
MAFNKESNGYIIGFSVVLVVVVGALLSAVSMGLKPTQDENLKNEKKQYILNAALIDVDRAGAGKMFDQYITKRIVLDHTGNVKAEFTGAIKDAKDAFNVDIIKEYRNKGLKQEDKNFPMYVCEKDGRTLYIVPVAGKGLWDLIWGYICFDETGKTIYGSVFDHKAETPGLGSKIAEDKFEKDFIGKSIEGEGEFKTIRVVKPGSEELDAYKIDGISGATFTGVGVQEMITRTMPVYYNYFNNIQTEK